MQWVRCWDLAATEKTETGDPAYTAGVLIGKRKNGRYVIADVVNKQMAASDVRQTMLSFYIDLSGLERTPFTNENTVEKLRSAYSKSRMGEDEMIALYFDTIREDTMPRHSLTVAGSFRVFTYCLLGKRRKLDVVLRNLAE